MITTHGTPNGSNGSNGHGLVPVNGKKNGTAAVDSALVGFYKLSIEERRALLGELLHLEAHELAALSSGSHTAGLHDEQADKMVENAVGTLGLPLGVCTNVRINGRDFLVPMSVEEPSVIAAASHASKLIRASGGVVATVTPPHMIGQIQLLDVADLAAARSAILAAREDLIERANQCDPKLVELGGGAFDLELRELPPLGADDPCGTMLVVHLLVDVRDAMGANAVNTMCERLAPELECLTGGRVRLRILSNLADRRLVTVEGRVPFSALENKGAQSGQALARGIEEASVFAERDPYRASTHNKGIMNGIDAVLIAFGQDWRAVEAGAHAYAARDGRYTALATWRVESDAQGHGHLVGRMTLPMAVGTVGGVARVHPTVQVARRIAGIESAEQLAMVTAAVGLAQNLGALRALAAEGIQRGHMRLHARNVAAEAGASATEIDFVAARMAELGSIRLETAQQILETLRNGVRA